MGNGYVETVVRRTTRNLLVANLVMLACVLLFALGSYRYLYNYVYGPFPMDRETLLGLLDPHALQQYYVTVQGDRVTDTGVNAVYVRTSRGSTTRSLIGRYVMVNFGNRRLLVKAPTGYTGTEFTGALQQVTDDEESGKISNLLANVSNRDEVLPFMMDATDFRAAGTPWVIVGIVLVVVGIWNLVKVARRTVNPEAHPLYRTLGVYGPVASMAASVDAEVAGGGANVMRFGKKGHTILTPHWLLNQSTFGVHAVHLDDLVWAYVQEIHGKGGVSYSVVLWTDKGTHLVIRETGACYDILHHVQEHAPWARVGNTPEVAKAWRLNRKGMVEEAVDRKRAFKAQAS